MLPPISYQKHSAMMLQSYIDELKQSGFQGDIETSYSSRLSLATDNSVYQQLPQAALFPKSTQDVKLLCYLAKQSYHAIRFSPRGGGTGTNGQSLTQYIVVDMSRHMREILEINIEGSWVRVQAGVVKDALNDALAPFGYFFSPDLSTSNRATIGGMINTDASGQGSLRYGKTSNHVLSLNAVFIDGSSLQTKSLPIDEIEQLKDNLQSTKALKIASNICQSQRELIEQIFPPLNRFLTGFDLKNAFDPKTKHFDVTKLLCGSEGTLAFVTEAVLNITKIPTARTLINIKYDSFDAALRDAPLLVKAKALSVETIDSTVLDLAKEDIIWHSVKNLLTEVEGKTLQAINIVEFAEDSPEKVTAPLEKLCHELDKKVNTQQAGILGYQLCTDLTSINRIYAMRKKAVGLLGAMKGAAKPVAFAEDTCVPPEHLADFIQEFRALLDKNKLNYGMFGHVDSGVIHVRPALDLCSIEQEILLKTLSDKVVALVAKYGGLMWGEHGKGYRSEYGPTFWGNTLFTELRKIKQAFDPLNQLNPGKICTPFDSEENLVQVTDIKRGSFDRQIPISVRQSFTQALNCNGNGLCFNYELTSPMCPSMKITGDRRHSPKGRAGIVREWLRLLAKQGIDPLELEKTLMEKSPSIFAIVSRYRHLFNKNNDFSHEVMEVLDGCLACKVCATQCPVKVDVPSFRARFIQLYHSRYPRPMKDYLVAKIERLLPVMAKAPKLVNALTQPNWAKKLTHFTFSYLDTPALSVPTLSQKIKHQAHWHFDFNQLQTLSEAERAEHVLILQDPFTSFYEAQIVVDLIHLCEKLGKKPVLLPMKPNGKAQHIKGFLREFADTAKNTADFLNKISKLGIPIVGIDPALVLCYRDEYQQVLGNKRGNFNVLLIQEWLLEIQPTQTNFMPKEDGDTWYLLSHCTEKTSVPNAPSDWVRIFHHFGKKVESVPLGCCGMAGTYGHEANKVALSKGIYALSWGEKLALLPKERCMVTGYSCRSQVKRIEQMNLLHPLQVLLKYCFDN